MKVAVVIAESALELIPDEIGKHSAVLADVKRRETDSSRILLDRSVHHAAMLRLKDGFKRGRPDLLHITLLSITSTPLYQEGLARVFIHTVNDVVLEFEEKTRPPKSYSRFRNLMEEALYEKPDAGLITVYDSSLGGLFKKTKADLVAGLSILGESRSLEEMANQIAAKKHPAVVIGGFPRGHFSPETLKFLDQLVRIDERPLDAHVVASRLIYEIEKARKDER